VYSQILKKHQRDVFSSNKKQQRCPQLSVPHTSCTMNDKLENSHEKQTNGQSQPFDLFLFNSQHPGGETDTQVEPWPTVYDCEVATCWFVCTRVYVRMACHIAS
jgi:hypothetical protein